MHPSTYEYLKPTDEQIAKMVNLRSAAKAYGDALEALLPEGPDKTFVIRNHRSNAMWANLTSRVPAAAWKEDTQSTFVKRRPNQGTRPV